MRETITVSLSRTMRREVDRIAKSEGRSRSDIVRESLEDYLFVKRFRFLRRRMLGAARGIYTDEDVFNRVS